jgi:hypothetical protein
VPLVTISGAFLRAPPTPSLSEMCRKTTLPTVSRPEMRRQKRVLTAWRALAPLCYPSDVTQAMIEAYRQRPR